MSRGGRGADSSSGVRAIASVLGIARQDVGAFTQLRKEPPPLYPPINKHVFPTDTSNVTFKLNTYKRRLLRRFNTSALNHEKRGLKKVAHYTDKYTKIEQKVIRLDFTRAPEQLNWKGVSTVIKPAKKRKIDDSVVTKRLEQLEAAEKIEVGEEEENADDDDQEEKDGVKKQQTNDEDEEFSDDDYQEEDNDYVQNYFDNGEGYGESDDNLDEDYTY